MNISSLHRLCVGIVVAALLVGTDDVAAAQQRTITGVVTDQLNNVPVAGARILLGNTNRTGLSNASGRYTLSAVPARTSHLRAIPVGFARPTHGAHLAAGAAPAADVARPLA